MLVVFAVQSDFVIETVRTPVLGEKRYRNGFAESIHLQSGASDRVDNTGVVDNFYLYVLLHCSGIILISGNNWVT